jgi:two-component system, OmpR family, flagellar system response regulator FtcR
MLSTKNHRNLRIFVNCNSTHSCVNFTRMGVMMIILVEQRELVVDGFQALFKREGVCITAMNPANFEGWFKALPADELSMIEGVLLADCGERQKLGAMICANNQIPVFALMDAHKIDETLTLFDAGFDDVLRKPIHIREILARIRMARSRRKATLQMVQKRDVAESIEIYFDGREPRINGVALDLPRRERRILEILHRNAGRRISKAQLFSSVYGIDDEKIEETVVESHISKLRKKLKNHLGYDPIDSQRFLGYSWREKPSARAEVQTSRTVHKAKPPFLAPSFAQAAHG